MKALRTALYCGLLFVSFGVTASAFGGQPPAKSKADDKKSDPQEKIEPKMSPGAGQKFLAQFAGEWTVEKVFYPRTAGAEPTKTKGTCVQEMIHEGRFLRSEFTFEGANGKSTGSGWIGFEPATGMFTSTWIDSRQTKMSFRQSKAPFDGKQIVLHGAAFDETKDFRKSKTISKLENDGKKLIHQQYGINADGSERLVMQMTMTRKETK